MRSSMQPWPTLLRLRQCLCGSHHMTAGHAGHPHTAHCLQQTAEQNARLFAADSSLALQDGQNQHLLPGRLCLKRLCTQCLQLVVLWAPQGLQRLSRPCTARQE
jgi:hypothetical protein